MSRRSIVPASLLLPAFLFCHLAQVHAAKDGPLAKLHQSLVTLHEQYTTHATRRAVTPFSSADPLVRLVEDRVVIDATASGDVEDLKADLESLGMQDAVAYGRMVSGQLPIRAIPAAAELATLRFVRSAAAGAGVGFATSQGDRAIRAHVARSTFGVDGSGVTVGVLSDSFNCLGGALIDVGTGDLSPVTVLQEISSCPAATDEGRAMLQIVHDVAPGAHLSFASAFNGEASFAANIEALASAGARVITDDVFYYAEPFFQDGIIAQAIDNVVAAGTAYYVLAGNDGRLAYDHAFVPGTFFPAGSFASGAFLGGTAHNFNAAGAEDDFQQITIAPHTSFVLGLQWDAPFFSVGGVGTQTDVDLYLLNQSHTQVLVAATTNNVTAGDPVEVMSIVYNGSAPFTGNLMIVTHAGPSPERLKYKVFQSPPVTINEYTTSSGTIVGHENARSAETVGAAHYSDTPAFGVLPPVKESFSSSGSTPVLFDVAGNRLATPDLRSDKPEIVAPDGVDTTFFGFDTDADGFPEFFGTSAAAPHAAAVAALLLQSNATLTPAQMYSAMETTAIDMDVTGFDDNTGFGLIQADAAVAAVEVPTRTLTVASANPDTGVSITVSPDDNDGQANGTTQFTRTYDDDTAVILIASAAAGGNDFVSWSGCDSAAETTCKVTMHADETVTAVYATPTRTLTVTSSSPSSGVPITVSPDDNNGLGGGTTQFTRTYDADAAVTLTAAATAEGNDFASWSGCDGASGTTCNVTMHTDRTVRAAFVVPLPDTIITSNPSTASKSTSATFSFTSTVAGSTFACSLDGAASSACTSPKSYGKLMVGTHAFEVRATDAAGRTDPAPAHFDWTIDTVAPGTIIGMRPPKLTNDLSATFSFTSSETASTFVCSMDRGAFGVCTSPQTYSGLANGKHVFQVDAIDAAGNADASPAKFSWTVDAIPPETTIFGMPRNPTTRRSAMFRFKSSESRGTFECNLDGGGFSACESGQTYRGLTTTVHTFQVRAIDAAGNVDAVPASVNWTIL